MARKHKKKRVHAPLGSAPDVVMVPLGADQTTVRIFEYNKEKLKEKTPKTLTKWSHPDPLESTVWFDVYGLGSLEKLKDLAVLFDLHILTLADIVQSPQPPKTEFDKQTFVITQASTGSDDVPYEQVSVVLGSGWVMTVREHTDPDHFAKVRERLQHPDSRLRQKGAAFLTYAVLDVLIDTHYQSLENQGQYILELEEYILEGADDDVLEQIQGLRKLGMERSRILRAQRKAMVRLSQDPNPHIPPDIRVYFRDVSDHAQEQLEISEQQNEWARSLRDLHMSIMNQKLNEVMQFLTLISTIFIPLSFLAGVYGMNFAQESPLNMPELKWQYGYLAWWLMAIAITVSMLFWFWHRGWIGQAAAFDRRTQNTNSE